MKIRPLPASCHTFACAADSHVPAIHTDAPFFRLQKQPKRRSNILRSSILRW